MFNKQQSKPNSPFQQQQANKLMQQVQQFAESNPLAAQVKSLGSPQAAFNYLMNNNMTIKGPNGQQMNIREFCDQMGVDSSIFR